jgi:hypothetical protein
VPAFLALLVVFGLVAVVVGNLLVQAAARRQAAAPLAFVDAPPVTVAPEGSTITGLGEARAHRDRRRAPWYRRVRIHRPGSATWLFLGSFAIYATVGAILVLRYGSIVGDAESRVADAWYVFFTRDPHLAAIGFVWNPLPSVLVMPWFLFKGVWPDLTHRAFAGNLTSSLFAAACVVQFRAILRELGTTKVVSWILVVAFIVNPMALYYGSNGMTEPFYLFFLLVGLRYLMRWLDAGGIRPLVVCGSALGFAYLVRYEALASAGAAFGVIVLVSFCRAAGKRKARLQAASCDALVFALPVAAAFIGWALLSYIITGHAFEQFQSQYGNSSQIAVQGGVGHAYGHFTPVTLGMIQLLAYGPLIPLLGALVVPAAISRRDLRPAAFAVLAGTIAFSLFAMVTGLAGPNLRYFIPALPLGFLCFAYLSVPDRRHRLSRVAAWERTIVAALVAVVLGVASTAATAYALTDNTVAPLERMQLTWVLSNDRIGKNGEVAKNVVPSVEGLTRQIDRMQLPSGSIVTDTFTACISQMLMSSNHPHQFIVTSDRDFQRVLADPPTFKAHYLLVPPPNGYGSLDAVTRAYPHLYRAGSNSQFRLVKTFHEPSCPALRLYKVVGALH